jgi:hypothetical protein
MKQIVFLLILLVPHVVEAMDKTTIIRRSPRLNPGLTQVHNKSPQADAKQSHERSAKVSSVTLDSMPHLKQIMTYATNSARFQKISGISVPPELVAQMGNKVILFMHQNLNELLKNPKTVQSMQETDSVYAILSTPHVSDDKLRTIGNTAAHPNDPILELLRKQDPEFVALEKRVIAYVTPRKCCGLSRLLCWKHKRS